MYSVEGYTNNILLYYSALIVDRVLSPILFISLICIHYEGVLSLFQVLEMSIHSFSKCFLSANQEHVIRWVRCWGWKHIVFALWRERNYDTITTTALHRDRYKGQQDNSSTWEKGEVGVCREASRRKLMVSRDPKDLEALISRQARGWHVRQGI